MRISNVPAPICKSCTVRISKAYAYLKQLYVSLKRVSKTSDPIVGKRKYLHVVALMFSSRRELSLSSVSSFIVCFIYAASGTGYVASKGSMINEH